MGSDETCISMCIRECSSVRHARLFHRIADVNRLCIAFSEVHKKINRISRLQDVPLIL